MFDLNEDLKKLFLIGVGAVAITAEKSKEIIDELMEKGQLMVNQGRILNEELKRNTNAKTKNVNTSNKQVKYNDEIKNNIYNQLDKLGKEEIAELQAKLIELQENESEQFKG